MDVRSRWTSGFIAASMLSACVSSSDDALAAENAADGFAPYEAMRDARCLDEETFSDRSDGTLSNGSEYFCLNMEANRTMVLDIPQYERGQVIELVPSYSASMSMTGLTQNRQPRRTVPAVACTLLTSSRCRGFPFGSNAAGIELHITNSRTEKLWIRFRVRDR